MTALCGREDEAIWPVGIAGHLLSSSGARAICVQFQNLDLWFRGLNWISTCQQGQVALFSGWRIHGLKRRRSGNQYFRL